MTTAIEIPDWCHVLQLPDPATIEHVKAAYRTLAQQHHPDRGGDPEHFIAPLEPLPPRGSRPTQHLAVTGGQLLAERNGRSAFVRAEGAMTSTISVDGPNAEVVAGRATSREIELRATSGSSLSGSTATRALPAGRQRDDRGSTSTSRGRR